MDSLPRFLEATLDGIDVGKRAVEVDLSRWLAITRPRTGSDISTAGAGLEESVSR